MFRALLILCGLPVVAFGAEQRFIFDNYFYGEFSHPETSSVNPGNSILQIPDREGTADLRPEWMLTTEQWKAVVRPRWVGRWFEWSELGDSQRSSNGDVNLMDAYVEYKPLDGLKAVAGLEVYQWGPAELMNVSNPLFHLHTNSHSVFFKEKGEALVRLSYDQNENWNHMLIANPISNNEEPYRAEQQFQSSGFLKSEVRNKAGNAYAGALLGSDDDRLPFIGEYGQFGWESGWSVYLDARQTRGNHTFVPQMNGFGYIEMDPKDDNSAIVNQSIVGVRWEGRVDVRAEFYWNSAGYTPDQFQWALSSVRVPTPWLANNLSRFLQPGLELLGRYYSYLSIRIPDLGRKKDVSIAFRNLNSLQDASGFAQFAFDKPLNDALVIELEADLAYGGPDSELTLASSYELVAGLKWTL